MVSAPPALGILVLDTRFPRVPGDVGNPATWPFPVRTKVVREASPTRVVHGRADGLLEAFVVAGRALAEEGAGAIVTTCGFLALHQRTLAARLPVPFAASSLLLLPMLAPMLPAGRQPGVITIDAESLTAEHLRAVDADPTTPIAGMIPDGEFVRTFLGNRPTLDCAAAEREVLDAGARLVSAHPDVGAVVLECANMPPYAAALRARLGVPVYDMVDLGRWLYAGLAEARSRT